MIRLTLADGRWLDLRPIYISDRLTMVELGERVNSGGIAGLEYLSDLAALVSAAIVEKSWEGSVLQMSQPALLQLVNQWMEATEAEAVPLASSGPSDSPSPASDSEEPTGSPSP